MVNGQKQGPKYTFLISRHHLNELIVSFQKINVIGSTELGS